uniref:Bidirectional sugar transporter SWEET2-like n=1 Tax=Cicer arietinum TaxID=3827 RepID=A0A3Q7YDX9_CICAR|nr:bidirectional sugar transporter SWEET2-like [Cicer arietinum]
MRKFDLSISGAEANSLLCVGNDATGIAGTYSFSMCHGYFYHMDAAGIADTFSFPNVRMFGLLLAVLGICGIILVGSLKITYSSMRRMFVGFLSCASLISMFASPLFIIKLVIRTKSLEFMPFCLLLSTFLISASFLLYGLLSDDAFFYVRVFFQLIFFCFFLKYSF